MLVALAASASFSFGADFVYTVNNRTMNNLDNTVSAFSVDAATGQLTLIPGSPFRTLGSGDGGGYNSAKRIVVKGNHLYVVNKASYSISGFTIDAATGALTPIPGMPFPVHGADSALSLAASERGNFLIAAIGGSTARYAMFQVDPSTGALTQLPLALPLGSFTMVKMSLSSDGSLLAFASPGSPGNNFVRLYSVSPTGSLTAIASAATLGQPLSVDFTCDSTRGVAAVGPSGLGYVGSGVSVFKVVAPSAFSSGSISEVAHVDVDKRMAPQVVQLSSNDSFAFTSDLMSHLSPWAITAEGGITAAATPLTVSGYPNSMPYDLGVNSSGTFLFSVNRTTPANPEFDSVSVYSIGSFGDLTQVTGSFLTGLNADANGIAVYPSRTCSVN